MWRRGNRFTDVVERQFDLLDREEADLLIEMVEAEARWNRAGRDEAEEAYGDYQLVVDAVADRLLELREAYGSTLDPDGAAEYRATFNRLAARRFRRHGTIAADLED